MSLNPEQKVILEESLRRQLHELLERVPTEHLAEVNYMLQELIVQEPADYRQQTERLQ